jgi:small subunit ribosomal protein S6
MKNAYEAMFILKPGPDGDQKKLAAEMDDQIRKIDGSIEKAVHVGRRKLAYPISHQAEGYYYLVRFQAPTLRLKEFERSVQLHESVIRFMVLKAENAPLQELVLSSPSSEAATERS